MTNPNIFWIRVDTDTNWNDGGDGLFAARDISQGQLIYTEFPETEIDINTGPGLGCWHSSILSRDEYNADMKYTIFGKNSSCNLVHKLKAHEDFDGTMDGESLEILIVTPSWVNHSCVPNMLRVDSSDLKTRRLKCQFFALGDITEGDELTIAYEPLLEWQDVSLRRVLLEAEYGFFCRCVRCVEEAELRDSGPPLRNAPVRNDQFLRSTLMDSIAARNYFPPIGETERVDRVEDQPSGLKPVKIWGSSVSTDLLSRSKRIGWEIWRAPRRLISLLKDLGGRLENIHTIPGERVGLIEEMTVDMRGDSDNLVKRLLRVKKSTRS